MFLLIIATVICLKKIKHPFTKFVVLILKLTLDILEIIMIREKNLWHICEWFLALEANKFYFSL